MDRILAIAWLRRRLLWNRFRRRGGWQQVLGLVLLGLIWGVAALGGGAVAGVFLEQARRSGDFDLLFKIEVGVFAAAFFAGVLLPLLAEKDGQGPVTGRLLAFPVTRSELFWISQAALAISADHLFYSPALIAVTMTTVLGPGSVALGMAVLISVWLCVLAWGHAMGLGIEAMLKGRRSREILSAITVVVILLLGLGPRLVERLVEDGEIQAHPFLGDLLPGLLVWARGLAPYQGAAALQAVRTGDAAGALRALAAVWAWLVPGVLIARWIFVSHHLGDRGGSGGSGGFGPRKSGLPWELRIPDLLPPMVTANAAKELKVALRSMTGRLGLVLGPVIAGFFGWARSDQVMGAVLGLQGRELLFYGPLIYLSVFAHSLSVNGFGYDGAGAQAYFLLPADRRQVLLGKNLGILAYNAVLLVLGTAALLAVGLRPSPAVLLTGILLFWCLALFRSALGNATSVLWPTPRGLSTRKQKRSTMGDFLSLGAYAVYLAVAWFLTVLPMLAGRPALQPLGPALLLAATALILRLGLEPAADLLSRRREQLIADLRQGPE